MEGGSIRGNKQNQVGGEWRKRILGEATRIWEQLWNKLEIIQKLPAICVGDPS